MSVGRTHISRTRGGQKTVGRPPFLRTVQKGRDYLGKNLVLCATPRSVVVQLGRAPQCS